VIGPSWRCLVVCACIAGAAALSAPAALGAAPAATALPAPLGAESEPNDAPAQASSLMPDMRVRASLQPAGDVDYYRFEAHAGDRVFANVVTAGQLAAPADSKLTLLAADGTTPLEVDDDNGSQQALASSIAGARIPSDGVYYLRVEDARGASAIAAPYDLYLALRAGAPAIESEPNNKPSEANPLINGEVVGLHEPEDKDWFAVNLRAGDTVFLSLDLDPERDEQSSDLALGFGPAGDEGDVEKPERILTVDDPQPGDPPEATPPSEAMTMTVSQGGTYYAYVDVGRGKADGGGPQATYDLAVSVFPGTRPSCRTYAAPPGAIPDAGTVTFPIQVDDAAQVARAAVRLDLQESLMADLDVSLRSPAGLELPLFTDIGATAAGGQQHLEAVFDDFAAMPSVYEAVRPLGLQPDAPLAGFQGQQAQGTWNLVVSDDAANGSVGSLTAAELVICPEAEAEPPPAVSPRPAASATPPPAPPQLTDLKIAPSRFRAAKAGGTVLAKRPPAGGAIVSYAVTAAARTELMIARARPGRRVGGKCVTETRANVSRKRCDRYVAVTGFSRDDGAGRNRFVLSGRVGGQPLPPGTYRLQALASAGPGPTSAAASATFTILPPAPR
jgi:subtilisin-like proprotein convertase family protein